MFSNEKKKTLETSSGSLEIDTVIGEQTSLQGDIRFRGGLHIDGAVEGSVVAVDKDRGFLVISEQGSVNGEVNAPEAIIDGRVDGDLVVSQRLELRSNARITGNVRYQSIEMSLGARVDGQLLFSGDDSKTGVVKELNKDVAKKDDGKKADKQDGDEKAKSAASA